MRWSISHETFTGIASKPPSLRRKSRARLPTATARSRMRADTSAHPPSTTARLTGIRAIRAFQQTARAFGVTPMDPNPRRHGNVEPTTRRHSNVEPTTRRHSNVEPTTRRHSNVEPTTRRHSNVEPTTRRHSNVEPTTRRHSNVEPTTRRHSNVEPTTRRFGRMGGGGGMDRTGLLNNAPRSPPPVRLATPIRERARNSHSLAAEEAINPETGIVGPKIQRRVQASQSPVQRQERGKARV